MSRCLRLALVGVALAAPAWAQGPDADWRTVSTAHFRVHYPAPSEIWALHAAGRLEAIRERVVATVGYDPPERVDVVVADPLASANGLAIPLLGAPRLVLWTTPPPPQSAVGQFRDWPEMLMAHEVTHLAHLTRPSRNPWRRLGEALLPVGPIPLAAPRWVVEGYATLVEGDLTGSGRPFSDLRAAVLRRRAQAGELPSYAEVSADADSWQGMSMAYQAGSAFLEWLREREGDESLRHLWARMTARRSRSFGDAFRGVFGDPPERLYRRFCAELTHRALTVEEQVEPGRRDGELWQDLGWSTGAPAVSPDGSRIALVRRFRDRPSELVVWSTAPDEEAERRWLERVERVAAEDPEDVPPRPPEAIPREPLHRLSARDGAEILGPRWTRDGASVVYFRPEPDPRGVLRCDLFRWWLTSGRVKRVTRQADLRDPDPSPGGDWAVAVRVRHGLTGLVRVDLSSGAVDELEPPSLEVCSTPRLDPAGERVAYLRHAGGRWRLLVRRLDDGAEVELATGDQAVVAFPAWSAGGREVLASVGRGGLVDVWAHPADGSGPARALTRTHGGSLAPAPTPDGRALFFLALEADGLDLRRLELEPGRPLPEASLLDADLAPAVPPPEPSAPPSPEVGPMSPPRPYGTGRQELAPLLGGAWAPSARTVELGARLGDVVGRLDALAVGSLASTGGVEGGAVAAAWRGWPVTVGGTLFAVEETPSEQPETVPGLGSELDRDRAGAVLAATWDRVFRGGRAEVDLSGLWQRVEPGGETTREDRALGLELSARRALERGRWRLGAAIAVGGQVGESDGERWDRRGGRLGLEAGHGDLGLSVRWALRAAGGEVPADERYALGGVESSVTPAAAGWGRVAEPALPVGALRGDRAESQRLELTWKSVQLFAVRHRLWPEGASRGGWLSLVGLGLHLDGEPQPLVKLPGVTLDLGVARVLDPPLEDTTTWWLSLAWRP